jgi:hypothetical protein
MSKRFNYRVTWEVNGSRMEVMFVTLEEATDFYEDIQKYQDTSGFEIQDILYYFDEDVEGFLDDEDITPSYNPEKFDDLLDEDNEEDESLYVMCKFIYTLTYLYFNKECFTMSYSYEGIWEMVGMLMKDPAVSQILITKEIEA